MDSCAEVFRQTRFTKRVLHSWDFGWAVKDIKFIATSNSVYFGQEQKHRISIYKEFFLKEVHAIFI